MRLGREFLGDEMEYMDGKKQQNMVARFFAGNDSKQVAYGLMSIGLGKVEVENLMKKTIEWNRRTKSIYCFSDQLSLIPTYQSAIVIRSLDDADKKRLWTNTSRMSHESITGFDNVKRHFALLIACKGIESSLLEIGVSKQDATHMMAEIENAANNEWMMSVNCGGPNSCPHF
jgi:hypothetical protein